MANSDPLLEQLMGSLGDFGRFQCYQFTLHVLAAFCAGVHMLSMVTVCYTPDHRCKVEGDSSSFDDKTNISSIPTTSSGDLESCLIYDKSNDTVKCKSYVYDTEYYTSSRVMDWDLVCDKRWMIALAQTIYMLGVLFGAVFCGTLSDQFGRKKLFCISAYGMLITGVGVAYTPEYYSFVIVRFIYGFFGSAGAYVTAFVLTMELIGKDRRVLCGVLYQVLFAIGIMSVAGWAALIRSRKLLQVVYGLHSIILFFHICLLYESPRWLWSKGRIEEAVNIVNKGLRINKSEIVHDKANFVSKVGQTNIADRPKAGFLDLFKTPNIRLKSLNVCLCWFANSLVYYGLSFNVGSLKGNPFLVLFCMGLVELPSYIITILLLDTWGRRNFTSLPMLAGGLCCIVAGFLPQNSIVVTVIAMIGKIFIASSFAVIYIYSAELFPTVIRNTAIGIGAMSARLSGASTPLISLLDSIDNRIPSMLFGIISIISGISVMFLPETMNQPLPETIEDGENFGKGDTFCTQCFRKKKPQE